MSLGEEMDVAKQLSNCEMQFREIVWRGDAKAWKAYGILITSNKIWNCQGESVESDQWFSYGEIPLIYTSDPVSSISFC